MSCAISPTLTMTAATTAMEKDRTSLTHRGRRHSYYTPRRRSSSVCNAEAVYVRVDLFLSELEHRFDRLEKYRQERLIHFDSKLRRAYAALSDVRESCAYASGELLWGAAKQRATLLVETLETKYNDLIGTRETLEQKAQSSMRLMESYLSELENSVQARQSEFSAVIDEGWRRVDSSLAHTREMIDEGIDKARRAKDLLTDSIAHALARASETRLISYEDLPVPWRVNPHIMRGYRFSSSKVECFKSAFLPSNETVNIWTHFIGLFIVLAVAFHFYPSSSTFQLSTKTDLLITVFFFVAACKCLICSTVWHTMNSIADRCLLERFACVDYTGISLLVAASIMSTEWTAFYCEPVSRAVYMSLTFVLGLLGIVLPWHPTFNRSDMAWARVAFYVSLAATGFAPIIQLNVTRGAAWSFYFYAPITKSVLVYLTGAVIYASQVPEKWWPGVFDYVGGSHNIWHLAVLGGILFHYSAMIQFFNGAFRRVAEGHCATM